MPGMLCRERRLHPHCFSRSLREPRAVALLRHHGVLERRGSQSRQPRVRRGMILLGVPRVPEKLRTGPVVLGGYCERPYRRPHTIIVALARRHVPPGVPTDNRSDPLEAKGLEAPLQLARWGSPSAQSHVRQPAANKPTPIAIRQNRGLGKSFSVVTMPVKAATQRRSMTATANSNNMSPAQQPMQNNP